MKKAKPFIKWVGGKSSLISQLELYFPQELKENKIKRYVEPFVGGGAMLFHILQTYNIKESFAFDLNSELINTYNIIKNNVDELIKNLKKIQNKYLKLDDKERKEFYYKTRKEYNKNISSKKTNNKINLKKAVQFIFLNKTCFNGLYRVNKKGEFNVPAGKYKNPLICDEENLKIVSKLIQNTCFIASDYKNSIKYINNNSFVYFDPPYRPLTETSSFTSYTKLDFDDNDQKQLALFFKKAHKIGANVMLSNSNPKNTDKNDDFFERLYKGFEINEIQAKRVINSNSNNRGAISELVITNNKKEEEKCFKKPIYTTTLVTSK